MKKLTIISVCIIACLIVAGALISYYSKVYENECAEIEFTIKDRGFTDYEILESKYVSAFIEKGTYFCLIELTQPEENLEEEMKSNYYTDIQDPKERFERAFFEMSDDSYYKDIMNENYLVLKYYDGKQKTTNLGTTEYYYFLSDTQIAVYILPGK